MKVSVNTSKRVARILNSNFALICQSAGIEEFLAGSEVKKPKNAATIIMMEPNMSRTYRRDEEEYETFDNEHDESRGKGKLQIKKQLNTREGKPGSKSPSWYKKQRSRQRRARRKASLQNSILQPVEKRDNDWNWT